MNGLEARAPVGDDPGGGWPSPQTIMKLNKRAFIAFTCTAAAGCWLPGQAPAAGESPTPAWLTPRLQNFLASKEKQAREMARDLNLKVAPDIWRYFETLRKGDWKESLKIYEALQKRCAQYEGSKKDDSVTNEVWQILIEIFCGCEPFATGDARHIEAMGLAVISSIPKGSIFFGGTDPGRGVITALSQSHADADPFFTLTQNAFANGLYLEYLRRMYGARIYIPTGEDSQKAFQEYLTDAQQRLEKNQLKPGEDVRIVDNRVQVSGQVAVMSINALLSKIIFEKNPAREFFIEESFPLDWMYPHLAPHGFIMKIHREPLAKISEEDRLKDRAFWQKQINALLGDWLQADTPVKTVCEFARRVYRNKNLEGFKGDPVFVGNDYSMKAYSKLRSAIAGLYAWRAKQASNPEEKRLLQQEAMLAFRQALALCPYSPEAIFRYTNLMVELKRPEDALLVVLNGSLFDPNSQALSELAKQLRQIKDKPQ